MIINRFSKFIKDNSKVINLALGEIQLQDILGQGGNGIVYSATILKNIIAIKFLISEATGKTLKNKKDRFLAEYFNISELEDLKGIVKYIDYDILKFEDEEGVVSIPVILMKKYDSSLTNLQPYNNENNFLNLFEFLIDTVEKIHEEGIIHRDLKPENILIKNSNFFLADFGIASYNPEIFNIRAVTQKGERVGNRLFSAPEQESVKVEAHETMDIYAIGQIMQWFSTGSTHRGTNRQSLNYTFEESIIYDNIIEKCISHNPENRFQKISDIREYIVNSRRKDIYYYMSQFSFILRRNFPKNDNGIVHSTDKSRIDKLFQTFKERENRFENTLWWHNGSSNSEFQLIRKGEAVWIFRHSEYSIKEIWIHYDNSTFNDFILVHFDQSKAFIVGKEEIFYTVIVDDVHHISYSEYENGFAEIDGDIVDLDGHKVEFIERQKEEGYFFIGTKYHCILRPENDVNVRNFIDELKSVGGKIDIEEVAEFQWKVRKHKLPEIVMNL